MWGVLHFFWRGSNFFNEGVCQNFYLFTFLGGGGNEWTNSRTTGRRTTRRGLSNVTHKRSLVVSCSVSVFVTQSSTPCQQTFPCCTVCLVWLELGARKIPYNVTCQHITCHLSVQCNPKVLKTEFLNVTVSPSCDGAKFCSICAIFLDIYLQAV